MRNTLLLVVLAGALAMTGCLTLSVYPLYTATDLVADLPLEGKWMDPDNKDIWEIRKGGDAYIVTDTSDQHPEPVELRLVRLGTRRFIDLTSNDTPALAMAGHIFGKVAISGEELRIQLMSSDWLAKRARDSGLALVEKPDKEVLLTASTADLQKLVLRYADDPEAFDKPSTLHRVR